jgi:ornithine cyclodeaminase/alanine dehydrogenase-like protein (mu-crystallin family)
MAANLRAKLPKTDTVLINDRSKDAMEGVVQEARTAGHEGIEALASPREVAERSVRTYAFSLFSACYRLV